MGIENYSTSAALNTTLGSIPIGPGMKRADVNNALQQQMADIAAYKNAITGNVNAKDQGLATGGTAAANLTALKNAISATPTGGVLVIPDGTYTIDTSGGLSAAANVNKSMTIILEGKLQGSTSAIQSNPPYVLNVTADDVLITGPGAFIGDGTINDVNTGTDATIPGLVYVSGDNFTIEGVSFVSAPKVGLMLADCVGARVSGCKFTGGPTSYSDTAHFGIRVFSGSRHIITGNRFYPDANGGMMVQCIFANGGNDCIIEHNTAYRPFEKLVYWFGDRNLISSNAVIGNTGTIAGTNRQGTITTVYRVNGSYNKIDSNYAYNCAGGATCMDGPGNEVTNNTFHNCGNGGVAIFSGSLNFNYTKVSGNTITYAAQTGVVVADGIYIAAPEGPSSYIEVNDNTVTGFSVADPIVNVPAWTLNTVYPKHSLVKPTVGNSRYYIPRGSGGTSGATEPTWPTTPGATVVDGTVTWECVAYSTGVQAEIRLVGAGASKEITNSTICNNNVGGGARGVSLNRVIGSKIANNKMNVTSFGMIESNGGTNRFEYNDVTGGAPVTVSGLAATSTFVCDIRGTWTPNQGAGLSVVGAFSSSGWYRFDGKHVTVHGEVRGATNIYLPNAGAICSNAPYQIASGEGATGTHGNLTLANCGTTIMGSSSGGGTTIYGTAGPSSGTDVIYFDITYRVA